MKAVVFHDPGHVELQERPDPKARSERESLIKILACGLCGSDMRTMTDPPQMPCNPDTVLGHEIVGVVDMPAADSGFAPGDVVVAVPNYPCRQCASCKSGLVNLCDNFEHIGSHSDGGLAEWLWVPDEFLHAVPAGLDPYVAALAEPLGCVLNGTTRASWGPGKPAVILGAGPIGLLFLAVAKLSGAAPVIVSEPNAARAALARDLGADHVLDPADPETPERIAALIGGHGAATVIDALGTLLDTALRLVAKGGEIFVFGVNHAAEIKIKPAVIVDKEVTIRGVYIAKGTFPLALQLLGAHQELFGKIVSDRIPIEQWARAKDLLMSGTAPGKILVTMGRS
jgi:threonine dehydrogenase-like Zn-dependent dehydrogenase